jgi:iron complex transport system substrate-binding protein
MNRITKKLVITLMIALLLPLFSACASNVENEQSSFSVVDCVGRTVQVPRDPKSIATLDPFAGQAVIMMGYGDRMPATINGVKRDMLLQSICPSLTKATVVKDSGSMNAEAIMALGIDLIFVKSDMYSNEAEREKIEKLGIPYVVIDYNSIEEQYNAFLVIGKALGNLNKAQKVVSYYERSIERVAKVVENIPLEKRPKLYHSVNEAIRTDNEGSIGADWIAVTGVNNVSLGSDLILKEKNYYTTLEQVFVWDPDIIICNESGVDDFILADDKWAGIRAVRNGNVEQIPIGVSRWGHPSSTETPLGILWLAKLIYPDYFSDLNMKEEINYFYKNFFDYELSEEVLNMILKGDGIRVPN